MNWQIETSAFPPACERALVHTMATAAHVLIVDDDIDMATALSDVLGRFGYRCDVVPSGAAALAKVENETFDAVVSDWSMEGMSGLELLKSLAVVEPKLPVIMVTGSAESRVTDAMNHGAFHYLTKPFDSDELQGVIAQAIGDLGRQGEGRLALTQNVLLPASRATRALLARIDRIASAEAPVLIQGESGSGKELVARAIHARSSRSAAPFVAINVAAIPEQLLESEIFGHVRGAFSGATQSRRGLLVEANHGTLLLDEIGDMPLGLQAKLLRALQFGEVRPIGSDHSHPIDVRFLSATHRNLHSWVQEGKFREDLYFRLNVLELVVPALRDRKTEIPGLIAHFLAWARKRNGNSVVSSIAPDAMRALVHAPWPGNVRELANVVERLVVMGEAPVVTVADLFLAGLTETLPEATPLLDAQEGLWSLDRLNHHYVDWVLAHTKGDKAQAAKILDINLSTLYRWQRRAQDRLPSGDLAVASCLDGVA